MTTKEFMRKIRRKLTELENAVVGECGYREAIDRSIRIRTDLEEMIEAEHKELTESAAYWQKSSGDAQ